jgi:MYXO-CTERM domain-containing protein
MRRLRGLVMCTCAAGILSGGALGAVAAPLIQSDAFAEAAESGEDPGIDSEEDSASQAGVAAVANAFRCLGAAVCAVPPDIFESGGAYARAVTSYGSNRARASASSHGNDVNFVGQFAEASSLWADDWIFFTPLPSITQAVGLDIHLDGDWDNGDAIYQLAVFDTTMPFTPNPDDPNPVLPFYFAAVAAFSFESTADSAIAIDSTGVRLIPIEDGGEASGSVDLDVTLEFVPVAGRTYIAAARLLVATGEGDSSVDFGSTGEITRIVLPADVSLSSAAGASWNTVVPEPSLAALLAVGVLALARRRR